MQDKALVFWMLKRSGRFQSMSDRFRLCIRVQGLAAASG